MAHLTPPMMSSEQKGAWFVCPAREQIEPHLFQEKSDKIAVASPTTACGSTTVKAVQLREPLTKVASALLWISSMNPSSSHTASAR